MSFTAQYAPDIKLPLCKNYNGYQTWMSRREFNQGYQGETDDAYLVRDGADEYWIPKRSICQAGDMVMAADYWMEENGL